jgi:Ca2+-binding RTX toxin-like protein
MAIINFSTLANKDKINLGGDKLVFDGGISAADVAIAELKTGVQLNAGGKTILLKDWELGNLNIDQVTFNNGSELLVGDKVFATTNDDNANMIEPFFPGNKNRDQLRGMGGDDELTGGKGDDLMFGQGGNDTLYGQDDDDWLDGGSGNDILEGGAGKDTIKGFAGSDTITGGTEADRLDGGKGADTFKITAAESPNGVGLFDKVVEFISASDKFDLDAAGDATKYIEERLRTGSYADASSKATELLVANEGLKEYVFIAGNSRGWLFGDFNSDRVIDVAIEILNGDSLARLDFSDII